MFRGPDQRSNPCHLSAHICVSGKILNTEPLAPISALAPWHFGFSVTGRAGVPSQHSYYCYYAAGGRDLDPANCRTVGKNLFDFLHIASSSARSK